MRASGPGPARQLTAPHQAVLQRYQPYCDEEVLAACQFRPAGTGKANIKWNVLKFFVGRPAARALTKPRSADAGNLPPQMVVVVGPTKVFVLAAKYSAGRADFDGPTNVWRRDDLELSGEWHGGFGQLDLTIKSTGERFAIEPISRTGSGFKTAIETVVTRLQDPTIVTSAFT